MNALFTSWMVLRFAPMRRHVMDEIIIFSGRSDRKALQVLQPGFLRDVPPPEVPRKTLPDTPNDVPVPNPKEVPPYEPKDVPPPDPDQTPQPKPSWPKAVDRLGEFPSSTERY